MAEEVKVGGTVIPASPGTAGLETQQYGQATTVDGVAGALGGIGAGQLMERDVDKDLFEFESEDTPLMSLMLATKAVPVNSPEVDHYMIDEEKTSFETTGAVSASTTTNFFSLPAPSNEKGLCQPYGTLRVRGVDGYNEAGSATTPGEDLMLFVTGRDSYGMPIVRAVNGPKNNPTDEFCTVPAIPAGKTIDVLANALHETQRKVEPDAVQPTPTTVYLQKRGMNQVVSDYFESQRKRIPFSKALIAERAIRKFKRSGNRTLWIGRKGKFSVQDPETGYQMVYCTEGIRWQFKRELTHIGQWTYREFVALAKMFYTGADVPDTAICLCGKNFLENIQCIDFSDHPEVYIEVKTNKLGWSVTNIHTVFGDFQFKREPTLDKIGYSNSAAIFGENRLVHYQRTSEHTENERIEGHEANRESVIVWDAIAMKGTCHIFVNGEGTAAAEGATNFRVWTSATAPAGVNLVNNTVYYFTADCEVKSGTTARAGEYWKYTTAGGWAKYTGELGA